MWHEARKQERKIRGMMVDYRRRAERRRDFYEKIKADPTQFLQLHGRQCKIHLDPSIASAADSPATMMPWQGQADNLIDRFDVRAHLDYIPNVVNEEDEELTYEEKQTNYERYRIIAQNSFLTISEEKFLKQLHMEEQFGYMEPESKKKKAVGAAIGFNYEDGTGYPAQSSTIHTDDNSDANSDSDLDVDLYINVSKVDQYQAHELNKHGLSFGMSSNDLYSFLTDDMEEAESNRLAREEEHEKALFSGRKSRRERRAHREKRLANRILSPPSYAARSSPTYPTFRDSNSASRSPSPANTGKITYITSFGDDDEAPTSSKASNANKLKHDKKVKRRGGENSPENRAFAIDNSEREKSYRRKRRSVSSESRTSRPRRRSRSRRRTRSRDRYRRRQYSRSRNRRYRHRRSSSSSPYNYRTRSRSRLRNRSYSKNKYLRRKSSSSSPSSHSSSVSRKSSHSITRKLNKSRSPSVRMDSPPIVTVQRYYGRKRSDQSSSSDLESVNEAGENNDCNNQMGVDPDVGENNAVAISNAGPASKKPPQACTINTMSVQERLKRKRQALLNKQYKADKLAEQQKTEREKQEQQNREDELREMAIKLRRRQRELRHAYESNSSCSSSDSDDRSSSGSSTYDKQRSKSRSPKDRSENVEYWPKDYNVKEQEADKNDRIYPSTSKSLPLSLAETEYEHNVETSYDRRQWDDYWKENGESKKNDCNDKSSRSLVDY